MTHDDWDAEFIPDILPEPNAFQRTLITRSGLRNLPPVEPLIHGVLSKRVAAVLAGPTGAGKTLMALSWACCVGTGHPWLGIKVERAPALYVLGEGGPGFESRIEAWETAWQTPVTDEDLVISRRPASLMDRDLWREMTAEVADMGAGIVVLDTLSSLAPDADETQDAATITRRMADLADTTGAAVVLVHHPGWSDSGRTRGGYQLEANTDQVFILHGSSSSLVSELEFKKVKEGVAGDRRWLRKKQTARSVVIEHAGDQEVRKYQADATEVFLRAQFSDRTEPITRVELRNALMEKFTVKDSRAYEMVDALQHRRVLILVTGQGARQAYRLAPPEAFPL